MREDTLNFLVPECRINNGKENSLFGLFFTENAIVSMHPEYYHARMKYPALCYLTCITGWT
jgi:hypothetical protein